MRPSFARFAVALPLTAIAVACSQSTGTTTTAAGGSTTTSVSATGTTASSSSTTSATTATTSTSTGSSTSCPGTGAPITALPACAAAPSTSVNVPSGCVPNVDGTIHADEWSDAACFNLSKGGAAYVKYAAGNLYLTYVVPPMSAAAAFAFDPDGGTTFDGDEFIVAVYGDPFASNGDEFGISRVNGQWMTGTTPNPAIVVRCPPNQPNPPTYEWKIPMSVLGVTPGQPHAFRFAINDATNLWPAGLTVDATGLPLDPSNWGQLSSSANWQ